MTGLWTRRSLFAFLAGVAMLGSGFSAQSAAGGGYRVPRIALVMGAETYAELPPVPNARNDADAVAAALRTVGFTFVRNVPNPRTSDVDLYVRELAKAEGGKNAPAIVVFFFAGHGFQKGADNYIVPVDVPLARMGDESIPMATIVYALASRRAGLSIFFFDACRNMLVEARTGRNPGVKPGFTTPRNQADAVMSMAAEFDQAASSAAYTGAANSPYSSALRHLIPFPRLSLGDMLREVHVQVRVATGHTQAPSEVNNSGASFYFHKTAAEETAEEAAWQAAMSSGVRSCLERFRLKYPDSQHLRSVLDRIGSLADASQGNATCPF